MTNKVEHKDVILDLSYFPFVILICIFGILGNFISLIVWKRLRLKSRTSNITTTLYFMVLAYVDIGVLVLSPLVMVLPNANKDLNYNYYYAFFFSYIGHPLHFYFVFVSIYLVTAMSVDRLRLVFRPFSRYNVKWRYTYIAIVALFVLAGLFNLPTFFEYEPTKQENGDYFLKEVRYKNQTSFRNIVFGTHCVGVVMVPWVTMLIANVLLIIKSSNRFREVRKKPKMEDQSSCDHRQLTHTLMLVSFATLLLLGAQCISRCITMFHYTDEPMWDKIHFARELGNLGLPLNSALNFLLFCLPGKKFRKEFRLLLRKHFCVKRPTAITPLKTRTVGQLPSYQNTDNPIKDHHQNLNNFYSSSRFTSETPVTSVTLTS